MVLCSTGNAVPYREMSTKTTTAVTHYAIQKKRRAAFIEEWRKNRRSVIRREDVALQPTARGMRTRAAAAGAPARGVGGGGRPPPPPLPRCAGARDRPGPDDHHPPAFLGRA